MDISYWTNLNSSIKYTPTTKQFYGRYLYRLTMDCPGAAVLGDGLDPAQALVKRQQRANYNYGGSWRFNESQRLAKASVHQLETLAGIRQDYKDTIKMRVEDPWVQLYARTEQELRAVATRFNHVGISRLSTISMPADEDQAQLLNADTIIVNLKPAHEYKVFIRDGHYARDTKRQILEYLLSLGNDVRVTPGTAKQLASPMSYIWGCFFYTNDPKLTTFISLIHPTLIRKIHKLVYIDK